MEAPCALLAATLKALKSLFEGDLRLQQWGKVLLWSSGCLVGWGVLDPSWTVPKRDVQVSIDAFWAWPCVTAILMDIHAIGLTRTNHRVFGN